MDSLNQIVNEQQRRKRARNSLIEFTHAIEVPGRPLSPDPDAWLFSPIETAVAPHHALLLRTADQVINTPQGRAMILMPPGSAKSTYCSSVLPTYAMGRRRGFRMMVTSYSSELARKHSRRARSIANSPDYFRIFDTRVSADAFAADDWALTNGSEYMAAGIQAGLTGNRADGIVIDDPVKGRDEANSEAIRTATRDAYEDDIKTRLTPGGWIILIQTRWHQDDLAGSILPADWAGESGLIRCRDGLDWNVLCVPARADRRDDPLGRRIGDYLWPELFPRQPLDAVRARPRTWNALYQQKPAPETGSFFEADWLHTCEVLPPLDQLRVYGASDYAVSERHGDYTVHIVVGLDSAGRMYVLDLWRRQAKANVWVEAACGLMQQWRPVMWAEEAGQINGAVGPFLLQETASALDLSHRAPADRGAFRQDGARAIDRRPHGSEGPLSSGRRRLDAGVPRRTDGVSARPARRSGRRAEFDRAAARHHAERQSAAAAKTVPRRRRYHHGRVLEVRRLQTEGQLADLSEGIGCVQGDLTLLGRHARPRLIGDPSRASRLGSAVHS